MSTGEPCFNEPTSTFLETSPLVYTAPQAGMAPRLSFDKRYRVPDPTALGVCKASRQVALSKYQLCFGTSQIYADLTTDIIFFHTFAQDIMEFLTDWLDTWLSRRNLADSPPRIIADLLRVQNLGYAYEGVYDTFDPAIFDEHGVYGNLLQHCHLDSYEGLKTVVLCDSVGFNVDDDSSEPGVIQFDDSANLEHRESYQCATRMIKRFEEDEDETSDDKPKPKIRFAPVKLSYNVPTFWDFIKNPYA
ncbi:hypothetical protein HYALB_00002497 [Hymenoscyphus albidus]|uniref:Uncharacterized protein n=1 Tax=Hymenoscyphus albidus TaxID=595503 RepID=A0A9N9LXP0_9HELO|nr:hypothetical protein HYALB_00002497 [Hymenoscyphus albidus]